MPEPLRIIYMGTPDFAVPPLEILVTHGYNVVAVVTAPDKPAGRGLQLQASAVKKCALAHNIPVLQPVKLKDPAFLDELRSYHANLQIVVAFRMLPEAVWQMPAIGTFNLHASLLPDYRGAAPINRAIMAGETETGLTTFFLKQEIDTGDILFQERMPVGPEETAGELHDRMSAEGAKLVLKTVQAIERNEINPLPQPAGDPSKTAPKIFKEDCRIRWDWPAGKIHDHIRGLSPYPAAWAMLDGKVFKIYRALKVDGNTGSAPGSLKTDDKTYMQVAAGDGYIKLLDVQVEGKKRMGVEEFLRGYRLKDGTVLS